MPLLRRARILIRWTAVLAGIALASAAIIILYGTALVDHALSGAARRNSWFVALRPGMLPAAWAGTDGNSETCAYGAADALEVWRRIDARMPAVFRKGEF